VSLRTKRVVVIGGTSGIGFAVAELALNEHAKVTVASSNPANVEGAVKRLAEGASGVTIDVTSDDSIATAFEKLGHIDHLVFTAGDWKARRGPVVDMDLESARANFTVRFWGALAVVKRAHSAIAPGGSGLIRTGVWDSIPEERRAEQFERMTKRQPLPRVGEPNEAAEAYLYLMRAGYTTGQVLHVDGGGSVI
jgi:NAD(P)-dependent dehydrogenase (short-subunit alcohol dehydrogenase family)